MMLKELREKVYEANMDLPKHGLVVFTWGNASEFDPETGLFVIKPSGVDYDELSPDNMVVCDLEGKRLDLQELGREGRPRLRPHPLRRRRLLGAGRPRHPGIRHDPCRLLLRPRALHARPDRGRDRGGLRA